MEIKYGTLEDIVSLLNTYFSHLSDFNKNNITLNNCIFETIIRNYNGNDYIQKLADN